MSRDAGFPTADVDVGYFDDPKVKRLVRSTRDEGLLMGPDQPDPRQTDR